jgi:hypothetical protein
MIAALTDLPLYGWAWTLVLLAVLILVVVVHERRTWRQMTAYRNQYRRRTIIVTDSQGRRRYA